MLGNAPLGAAPLGASGANPKPLGTYVLQGAGATYALAGGAVTFKAPANYKLTASPGVFVLTGDGAGVEQPGYQMAAAPGAFALTGVAATFARPVLGLAAAPGAFALTGGQSTGGKAKALRGDAGTFAFGYDTGATLFKATYTLRCDGATYALAIQASTRSNRGMPIDGATYALAGRTVKLRQRHALVLDPGAYALTSADAHMGNGYLIQAGTMALRCITTPARLAHNRNLVAAPGTYTLVPDGAASAKAIPILRARPATFNMLAADAQLVRGALAPVSPGTYTLTGLPASTTLTRRLKAGTGMFARTGQPVDIHLTRRLALQTASLQISGGTVTPRIGRGLRLPITGVYGLLGSDATMTPAGRGIRAEPGRFTLFGYSDVETYTPATPPRAEPVVPKPVLPGPAVGDPVLEQ